MKTITPHSRILRTLPVLTAVVVLLATSARSDTESKTTAQTETKAATPTHSEFDIPASASEGRDPFFPNSTRLAAKVPVKTNTGPVALTLKAISGTTDRRLAIINDRTFAVGETAEVRTAQGRVSITCLEIEGLKVRVQIGSEKRELSMRDGTS